MKTRKIGVAAFVLVAFFMIIVRCFYGINFDDELAYLSVVKRMNQGQWIIIHDWNTPTLLSSWLTYQLLRLIDLSNLEAIAIAFRLLYMLFQCCVSFFLLVQFKKTNWAYLAILVYLFATPYNINTLSYNTLSIGFMLIFLGFVTIRTEWRSWSLIFAGVLFSLCVLSNPYVLLLYAVYFAVCLTFHICKKVYSEILTIKGFCMVTAGAILMFFIFCLSMAQRFSINEYVSNMRMLLQDAEHIEGSSLISKLADAVYSIFRVYWRVSVPLVALTAAIIIFRKREKLLHVFAGFAVLFTAYGIIRFSFIYGSVYPNLMLVPINFIGIAVFFLTKNKNKRIFWGWYVVGLLYSLCIFVGTNTGILSGSAAFVIPSVATFLLIHGYAKEQSKNLKYAFYTLLLLELGCIFYLRIMYVWADGELLNLQSKINSGACKYLYTSTESYERYQNMLEDVSRSEIEEKDKVLFLPMQPLYYLENPGINASPYTKRFAVSLLELQNYYTVNPNMYPDVVIATSQALEGERQEVERILHWFENMGYRKVIDENGYIKMMKEGV